MLKGTRIMKGEEARKYAEVCDKIRRYLHR